VESGCVVTHQRYPVLGVQITAIERPEAANAVMAAARDGIPLGVSALAVHGVMEGVFDPELQYRLNDLEMVVADGQPVRWALRWLHGVGLTERVYGPDLMNDVCGLAAREGIPIFLYGSTSDTLSNLGRRLTARHPGLAIAGSRPSRFRSATPDEQEEDVQEILSSGARVVFAGLGCPRQEIWTWEMRRRLSLPVLAVGAAFDFHAGTARQAPAWMQRRGLEWLYRLMQEPRRLWRRYLFLNPGYLALVALQATRLRTIPTDRAKMPSEQIRPG
jgi:N-acetylglucosaminyldiphosphoundecaprenol N-acetyl-beta-D-mannosaminyltransferase